ncbi:MAG: hemolysin family protein [Miltoncostaeaceae bacterium]
MASAIPLVAALLLVLLNGFFVAAEFALARARTTRLEAMSERGVASAGLARGQIEHIDRYLAACQLGITLASLGLGWLGEPAFGHLLEPVLEAVGLEEATAVLTAGILAFVIITVLHVVVGELAPKSIAIQRAERTAMSIARPLEWFRWLLSPLIKVLNGAGNMVVRLLGVDPATPSELASTPEDIQRLIDESEEGGNIEPDQAEMLEGVFSLHDHQTREIMTPRPHVRTLEGKMAVKDGLSEALKSRHSRFPVVDDEDNVLGVVHLADLSHALLENDEGTTVREVAGTPLFVLETQAVDDLLDELQSRHASMAVVLDEYGDLAGVVAVEDVIEEIVGEIDDERDRAPNVDARPDGRLIVRGHVPLEDLADHGIEIDDETVTSVGGLVFTRLGRLPRTGDSIRLEEYVLTVEATQGTRVMLVAVEREEIEVLASDEAEAPGDEERGGPNGGNLEAS